MHISMRETLSRPHVNDPSGTKAEDTTESVGVEGGGGEVNMKFTVHA